MDDLSKRLARGEAEAFAELYDAWADRVHHYLVARLGSDDAAAEIVQETFVRIARWRRRLKKVDNLGAYLFQIARNESSRFQTRRRREAAFRSPSADVLFLEASRPGEESREITELVCESLGRLPPEQRELIELKVYSGFTFREIAQLTGLPQGTVATRYRAAIGRLRVWLAKEFS